MKYIVSTVLSLLAGALIAFFGVLVSVFSDGGLRERLITIAIILLIYAALSFIFAILLPRYSWKWGLLIGAPGVLLLGYYLTNEYNPYYFAYMALILCLSCLGAWLGSRGGKRQKA